jgi:HD-GYP domain-containing protein (c-di-GMP phosphodiesterase class II)
LSTTIQAMIAAVESKDPYTAGHQLRSADLSCAIARELGLSEEKIEAIHMAGSIHDIGKLSIPSELLTKPTKLTDLEFRLVKEHARRGYDILKEVGHDCLLAETIHQHHERINGSGYPRGLTGSKILLDARILMVADVVESMASHRPYRAALGIQAALEEIEKNRGILYDADVVDACLRLFREKGFQLKESDELPILS